MGSAFVQSPLASPLPSSGSSGSSGGGLKLSPLLKKRARDQGPDMPPNQQQQQHGSLRVTIKRPATDQSFEAFLKDPVVASKLVHAAARSAAHAPEPMSAAPVDSLLSLAATAAAAEPAPALVPCGEVYVTDWLPQGDNMKRAAAGDPVVLRVVRREGFKPAVQVMRPAENYTYCWLQPTQCAMVIPLLEGGNASIQGHWMRAASVAGVRLALLLRVAMVAARIDATRRIHAKTSAELAAWTTLAQLVRINPSALLSNPTLSRSTLTASVTSAPPTATAALLDLTAPQGESSTETSAEDVGLSELDALLRQTRVEAVPMDPCDAVTVALHPYQREGLGWMVAREASGGDAPAQFEKRQKTSETPAELPPGWEARTGPGGKVYYHNTATGVSYNQHPSSRAASVAATADGRGPQGPITACGGILADDMGLGKTVMMIALVATVRPLKGARGTLIVCPLSVMGQWERELSARTKPGTLSVLVYHGPSRPQDPAVLAQYDVVLTTYATLAQELAESDEAGPKKRGRGGAQRVLLETEFFRCILDEAHTIKDRSTRTAKACFEVRAPRRWAVTGTPIQNKLEDVFALLHFIRVAPWGIFTWFQQHVLRPIKSKDARGFDRLKQILGTVLLRRTKSQTNDVGSRLIELPPRTVNIVRLHFSDAERAMYDGLFTRARSKISSLLDANAVLDNYAHVLLMLLRLRQLCDHPALVDGDAADAPAAGAGMDKECQQCFNDSASVATACRHEFCQPCLEAALMRTRLCPVCASSLSPLQCRPLVANTRAAVDEKREAPFFYSTKIRALLDALGRTKAQDATIKSVVFSQFTSMLDQVEKGLEEHGIGFVRLDGSMAQAARVREIERFRNDPSVRVFLISMKAGGLGLNLTCANHVYILDPWWNPQIESQAIDRVYRIGQTRPVVVTRFVVHDTIEEAMLKLQESKIEVAFSALASGRSTQSARIDELKSIFGLE